MEYVPGPMSVKGSASPAKMSRIVGVRSMTVGVWDASVVATGAEVAVAPVVSGPDVQAASASTTANARARPRPVFIVPLPGSWARAGVPTSGPARVRELVDWFGLARAAGVEYGDLAALVLAEPNPGTVGRPRQPALVVVGAPGERDAPDHRPDRRRPSARPRSGSRRSAPSRLAEREPRPVGRPGDDRGVGVVGQHCGRSIRRRPRGTGPVRLAHRGAPTVRCDPSGRPVDLVDRVEVLARQAYEDRTLAAPQRRPWRCSPARLRTRSVSRLATTTMRSETFIPAWAATIPRSVVSPVARSIVRLNVESVVIARWAPVGDHVQSSP